MKLSDRLKEAKAPQDQIDAAIKIEEGLDKANDEAGHHRKSKKELKDQLAKFDGVDPEEFIKLKKHADDLEQERLKAEGKFDDALAAGLKEKDAEIESLKGLLGDSRTALSKQVIDNSVMVAIDGKAVNNEQVLSLIRGNIKMEGDTPVVMKGEAPMLNESGEKVTVSEYATTFLTQNPHLVNPGGGGAGSGGNQGSQNQGGNSISRETYDTLTPAQQSKHCADGGIVTD